MGERNRALDVFRENARKNAKLSMAERVGFEPLGSVGSKELGRSCDPLDPPDSLKCLGRDTY